MQDMRVGLVVFPSRAGGIEENLDRTAGWVRRAKAAGADAVCFPEMSICGYSVRSAASMKPEPVPGAVSRRLAALARGEEIAILAGMAEKGGDGRCYAAHMVAAADGRIGVYRKLHISPPENEIFAPAGSRVPLFSIHGTLCGIQLCYDAHFPELSTRMAAAGAEVIFFPHASPRGTPEEKYASWMRHLTARAYDNGVFVLACNPTGTNGEGLDFPGLALAIGPDGRILEKDAGGEERLLMVDLKARDLAAVRCHRMRYFFPNRRPDMNRLICEEESWI